MNPLQPLFDSIRHLRPAQQAQFRSKPVPAHPAYMVGVDADGLPALLALARGSSGRRFELEHLSVQQGVRCSVERDDGVAVDQDLTVVRCKSPALEEHFLRVASMVVSTVGGAPTQELLSRAIDQLAELFLALSEPPRKQTQGLWAELFLMASSENIIPVAEAWHATPTDLYDFNAGEQRVEVKSSSGSERVHHFSLRQLQPPEGTRLVVASVMVDSSGAGSALGELLDVVQKALGHHPSLAFKVERQVALTLGRAYERAMGERFDVERARTSLMFFNSDHVPAVTGPIPAEVTDVRFRARLDGLPGLSADQCRRAGGLLRALAPTKRPFLF